MQDLLPHVVSLGLGLGLIVGCDSGPATSASAERTDRSARLAHATKGRAADQPSVTPPAVAESSRPAVAKIAPASPVLARLAALDADHGVTMFADVPDLTPVTRKAGEWVTSDGGAVDEQNVIDRAWISPDATLAVLVVFLGTCGRDSDDCGFAARLVDAAGTVTYLDADGSHPEVVAWSPHSREVAIGVDAGERKEVLLFSVPALPGTESIKSTVRLRGYSAPSYRPDGTLLIQRDAQTFARAASGELTRV